MGRFLFAVVVFALVWWGYESFYATEAGAKPVDLGGLVVPSAEDGQKTPPASGEGLDVANRGSSVQRPAVEDGASFLTDLAKGEPEAVAGAMSRLAALDASRRGRLAAAILDWEQNQPSLEAKLALLGPNNAFLRTEEGRGVAQGVLRAAMAKEPGEAIAWTSRLIDRCMRGPLDSVAREQVWEIYAQHLGLVRQVEFNPASAANSRQCKVKRGDSLARIAKRYRKADLRLESGTLQVVNRIKNPDAIQVGQQLRIPMGAIRTVVEKRSFLLAVYIGGNLVRLYPCAHGKPESPTPVTVFTIQDKISKPAWYREGQPIAYGDPANPLGTHFVKFAQDGGHSGFGIHGTWEPASIGSMASMGCVRLRNEDVREYYTLVPRGTKVEIRASE